MSGETYPWADCVALLAKQPRTLAELQKLSGVSETTARRYLKALSGEGLVGVVATTRGRGDRTNVWGWLL